jgi:chromatin segregation and condensation protein Rec8/ScpA/Scc1 (kleisin family)
MEEDLFHLLIAPPPPQRRRLSLDGARVLAGQLREVAALRHDAGTARVGRSRARPFDLHALVPVPPRRAPSRSGPPGCPRLALGALGYHGPAAPRRGRACPGVARPFAARCRGRPAHLLVGRLDAMAGAGGHGCTLARAAFRCPPDLRRSVTEAATPPAVTKRPAVPVSPTWGDPPRSHAPATSPVLAVAGFEGPLDWLLDMARARKIDLARLSILALVEAFAGAMEAALHRVPAPSAGIVSAEADGTWTGSAPAPDLARWADRTVMAAQLTELRSRLLLPADTPEARTALAEAEALRRQWVLRAEMAAAADWLERRPRLGLEVCARGRPGIEGQGPGVGHDINDNEGPAASRAGDAPVEGGDITDLLRACLVALRLPPHAETYQPGHGHSGASATPQTG